ncbi:MAG TPA: biliverdin-producing heme oxygenase [Flavisolibacter sp.]|jgi:heme oxygenase|nr:biliverdin-producing heme oxygenase [Flavisolibacter sp.]
MPLTANATLLAGLVKNATQRPHKEVEDILLPVLTSIRTTDDYAVVLKMFYGYFHPVEKQIEQHLPISSLPDLSERRKADSILEDLRLIGHGSDSLPLCTALPPIGNTAQAFGALYVLEGSTLGGKQIAKMLAKNPILPAGATRFFTGYGDQTGTKWKGFLEVFNQQSEQETIITSANETFNFLKGWMQHFF